MDTNPLFEFSDRAELRQWLEENHGTTPFCWVATTRGKEPRCGAIPYPEVVEECLCFGWIDSTLKRLDEGRQAQRISPRKRGSTWTILNTRRFRDLDERGLVTEAGWKAFREAGKKEFVDERDLMKILRRRPSRATINFRQASRKIRQEQREQLYHHKCSVCGRTDTEYPGLEFRYCSRCAGYHCFCIDHINNHIHFTE